MGRKPDKPVYPGTCNLECKKKGYWFKRLLTRTKLPKFQIEGDGHQEFITPIKVVLVTTPKREYWKKTVESAFVILAFITIGATVIPMYFYSFSHTQRLFYNHTNVTYVVQNATHNYTEVRERDPMMSLHVLFFTAGFQMLTPFAFLTLNTYNGASTFIQIRHKNFDFLLLKVISISCVFGGLLTAISSTSMKFFAAVWSFEYFSVHAATGVVAVLLSLVDIGALLCFALCSGRKIWPKFSIVLCIPSFITSSVCFLLSLSKVSFLGWLPSPKMIDIFTLFCLYYTVFCIWNPLNNLRCGTK